MSLSDNYPDIRSVWMNDYANAGVIDPRCVFTRNDSTPSNVHYWSDEDHVSSENLLPYSENVGLWVQSGLLSRTGGQTDPAGGSTGFTLQENSSTGIHRISQNVTASGDLAFTVYAKQGSGTRYLTLALYYATANTVMAVYDLAGGSPVTATGSSSTYTSITASQTASGNGYYKCVLKATGSATVAIVNLNDVATTVGLDTNWGTKSYTGDGSSSLLVAYTGLSTVGSVDYNSTSGQIHREYAATLKSVAYSGQPRFEYEPTGDREAKGLLIESSSSNLIARSYEIDNAYWSKQNTTVTAAAAVGVTGSLNACLITESAEVSPATNVHSVYSSSFGLSGATSCTFSVYCKAAGVNRVQLLSTVGGSSRNVNFNIANGTVISESSATGAVEAVGDGFYRISLTYTAPATTNGRVYLILLNDSDASDYTGNGYNSVIASGFQYEQNSFQSSYIATSGSASTRSADSLSFIDDSIFEGGEHSIYWEGSVNGSIVDPRFMELSDGTVNNRIQFFYNDGSKVMLRTSVDGVSSKAAIQVTEPITGSVKLMATLKTAEARVVSNGTTITSATSDSFYSPSGLRKLNVGTNYAQGAQLNGHVKRVAVFSEALTETEAQSLTS